jgi:hypothetical protein
MALPFLFEPTGGTMNRSRPRLERALLPFLVCLLGSGSHSCDRPPQRAGSSPTAAGVTKRPAPARSFSAEVVMRDGTKIAAGDVKRVSMQGKVAESFRSLVVNTGEVNVVVPFETIAKASFEERGSLGGAEKLPWLHATVRLGDGSVLQGELVPYELEWQTSLGKVGFDPARYWHGSGDPSIASLTFNQKAEASSAFVGHGSGSVVVHRAGGGEMVLEESALMDEEDKYARSLPLQTSTGAFQVEWSRIATIVPKDPIVDLNHYQPEAAPLTVTLKDGQSARGLSAAVIEGAAWFGHYKLQVWLSLFRNSYAKLEVRS